MKRFWLLLMVALVVALPVAGCLGEVKTYADSGQTISIGVDKEFIVVLGSIPSTGYSWHASYDTSVIKLVDKRYEMDKQAGERVIGAGGVEFFRFRALKKGETRITMTYKREWEEKIVDEKLFTIKVE
ncbi:MAG: protease inhibitor I42 family protein [Chloroflexi bacterium]|nr:protease inhibitor I42 family protein [Chloroflexota bacterium]MBI2979353.1 protease inhibitor I42 family protein [Chloroflexota bacterium]